MSSVIRFTRPSWLALLALVAFLCSLQAGSGGVGEALSLFKKKEAQEWDDYDSSSPVDRESRRIVKLKAVSANWESFKKSPLFLEPVESGVTQIPVKQLEFEYEAGQKNIAMFKEIVRDAIAHRDDIFAGTTLITKWGFTLIKVLIKNKQDEMKIKDRYDPKGLFFDRMADALSKLVEMSTKIKKDKKYKKHNVDIKKFEVRAMEILTLGGRILEISPVGVFLKWDTLKLYMDNPQHPLHGKPGMDEAADLFAQFRAIGYESATFMAKRLADLLRAFGKGQIPKARSFI